MMSARFTKSKLGAVCIGRCYEKLQSREELRSAKSKWEFRILTRNGSKAKAKLRTNTPMEEGQMNYYQQVNIACIRRSLVERSSVNKCEVLHDTKLDKIHAQIHRPLRWAIKSKMSKIVRSAQIEEHGHEQN